MLSPKNCLRLLSVIALYIVSSFFAQNVWGQCTVEIGPSSNFGCEGGSFTLSATLTNPPTSPTYSWTGPNGFTSTSSSITINNLDTDDEGLYTVTVGGGCNTDNTDEVDLEILENFSIVQNDITLCPGDNNLNFNPSVSGNNGETPVYSWSGPNGFTSTNLNPSISNATSTNGGTYTVTATIGQCNSSDNVNVVVLNSLEVTASNNGPLCQGQTLNLTSNVTGNAGQNVSYSWTGPNGFTSSQSNPSIANAGGSQNGTYSVTVSSNGCSDNTSTTSSILVPTLNSAQFSTLPNYNGWLVRCTLPGQTSGPISISNAIPSSLNSFADSYNIDWGDGTADNNYSTDTWTAPHVYALGLYTLTVTITSTAGCSISQTYQVFVGNQPASPQIQLPANAQGCSPFELTFPISGVSNNVPGTTYTITFSDGSAPLYFNQSNIPTSIQHTFNQSSCGFSFTNGSITENNAFGVSMQAVNPCGSASASAGPIRTSAPPTISFDLPSIICVNQNAIANNTSSPGTINLGSQCLQEHSFIWDILPSTGWSINAQTLGSDNLFPEYYDLWTSGSDPLTINFNQSGNYSVELTEKNACESPVVLTKTICVIDPPTCSFTATPSSGCSPLTVNTTNNSVAPLCNGSAVPLAYSWVVSTPSNPNFATSTLAQPSFILTNSGTSDLVYTLTLTVTPLDPVTNLPIGNCTSTCSQTVTVYPIPTMTNASSLNLCSGGTMNLDLTSNIPSSYSWSASSNNNVTGIPSGNQTSDPINLTLTNNSLTNQTVTFQVTPTSTSGSCVGNTQTITLTLLPTPVMNSASSVTICDNTPVNLALTASVGSSFSWVATPNANVSGESTTAQNSSTINNTLDNTTNTSSIVSYSVTPTSTTGSCVGNAQTVQVTVNPTPVVTNNSTAAICSGSALNINLTSNVGASFSWVANDNINVIGESLTAVISSNINNTLTNNTTSIQNVIYTITPSTSNPSCTGTPFTLTVSVVPAVTVNAISPVTTCNTIPLNIPVTANVPSSFSWSTPSNGNVTGESAVAVTSSTINDVLTNTTTSSRV